MIPVNSVELTSREQELLIECIKTGWISSEGPFVAEFENGMAERVGRRYGVAVSSGSAALDVAVKALGIGALDEVIMPAFTIISCASAVVKNGALPVLVDIDQHTWNMKAEDVAHKITDRTRAVMAVHTYGLPVDMDPLLELCRSKGLLLIEDAAEQIGQTYHGRACGSFGDISVLSFYANKHVTTGEGGMVLTDDPHIARRCRSLRNLCFEEHQRFVHKELGWNYRMTNLQAAVGVAQLERLDETIAKKRRMGNYYNELLSGTPGLQLPEIRGVGAESIFWVYGVAVDEKVPFNAADIMGRLKEKGIGTRPFFWPMHWQPVFREMGLFDGDAHPVSERLATHGFYLPSGSAMTPNEIRTCAEALNEIMTHAV